MNINLDLKNEYKEALIGKERAAPALSLFLIPIAFRKRQDETAKAWAGGRLAWVAPDSADETGSICGTRASRLEVSLMIEGSSIFSAPERFHWQESRESAGCSEKKTKQVVPVCESALPPRGIVGLYSSDQGSVCAKRWEETREQWGSFIFALGDNPETWRQNKQQVRFGFGALLTPQIR